MFLSQDSGASWRKVLAQPVTSRAFDSQGNVFVGMLGPEGPASRNNILTRCSNVGLTWTNLSLPIPPAAASAQTQWVSILARGATLYVIVSYEVSASSPMLVDFYRSADGGSNWVLVPAIGRGGKPVTLLADADANNLYVAGTELLASRNQGNGWSSLATTTGQFHAGIFLGQFVLLAGERGLELVPLVPGLVGRVFFYLPIGQYLDVVSDSSGIPWAAGPHGLFAMRGPAGVDCWFQTPTIPHPILPAEGCWKMPVADAAVGNVVALATVSPNIFAGGNARVYYSSDGGANFSSSAILNIASQQSANNITAEPVFIGLSALDMRNYL